MVKSSLKGKSRGLDFGHVQVEIPPGAFLQATADAEDILGGARLVLKELGRAACH